MNKITIICPEKYRVGDGEIVLRDIPREIMPLAFATLDGKPSEQYEPGKMYIAASLITNDPNDYTYVLDRVTALYGAPLVKPAQLRKRRRLKYLTKILDAFLIMKSEARGFPLTTLYVLGSENALDPSEVIDIYRKNSDMRKKIFISKITERHVHFGDDGWTEVMTHEQFGGVFFWTSIIRVVDEQLTKVFGNPIHWCLMADNLPCDSGGRRMTILFSMLEEMFGGRLMLMYTKLGDGEVDMPADLLTDIFASISFEISSTDGSNDPGLNEAFRAFNSSASAVEVLPI